MFTGEPIGDNDTNIEIVVSVDLLLAITATKPMAGEWQIQIQDDQFYEIDVTGQSTADFTYQFLETDESGATYPLVGTPIAGSLAIVSNHINHCAY